MNEYIKLVRDLFSMIVIIHPLYMIINNLINDYKDANKKLVEENLKLNEENKKLNEELKRLQRYFRKLEKQPLIQIKNTDSYAHIYL